MPEKARVAVLISGTGSNMAAILYAAKLADSPYEVVLVGSNNPACAGLKLAQAEGVATFAKSHKGLTREDHDAAMHEALVGARADYVVLAGYMRILTPGFVSQWEGRMMNIHPSLLPKYKGLDTHQRALDAGDKAGGCSVHLVTAGLDDGPVLGQTEVAIMPGDTAETLAARVLIAEHQLYPRMLAKLVSQETDPHWLLDQVRERALALPESEEVLTHGMPCFGIVKGKKFGYFANDHHGNAKIALIAKISGVDEQQMLIAQDEDRYYRPAYFGDGWIAIRLDLPNTDWDAIADWLARSWRAVAPKKLTKLMDLADDF